MRFARKTRYFDPQNVENYSYEFKWKIKRAPVVASDWFSSIAEIDQYLSLLNKSKFTEVFEEIKKNRSKKIAYNPYLKFWIYLTLFIIPLFWMIFTFRLINEFFNTISSSISVKITLLMLIIVAIAFASPPIYLAYRLKQDSEDAKEQLELLSFLKSSQDQGLHDVLFEKDNQVFWKVYRPHWRVSLFYPEFSFLDILGLFSSIFSLVYLFTWFFKSFSVNISHIREDGNFGIVALNIILLIIFLGWVFNGYIYGSNSDWYLVWRDNRIKQNITQNLLLLAIGVVLIVLVEIQSPGFRGTYMFPFLMSEIPLIMAFITNKFRLFKEYNQVKEELIYFNNLQSIDLDTKFMESIDTLQDETKLLYSLMMIMKVRQQLNSSPTIPATRIRSYGLLITFVLSVIGSIFTAFNSSVDQFTKLLSLVIP